MGRVEGKVALVTGGAMGIGEAAVRRFASEGASVAISDIAIEQGGALADEVGRDAVFFQHDVTDDARWHDVIAAIHSRYGRLDIVMNNAGLVSLGTVESVSDADWAKHMALHADATFIGTQLGLRAIRQSGCPGSIINMASTATVRGYSPHFAYLAAKGAVRGLTRSAAAYCRAEQLPIRVNCIIPGGILTPMAARFEEMAKSMPDDVQFSSSGGSGNPDRPLDLATLGEPDEIGALALYLGSDESRFVNGAEFVVDNGATRLPPMATR